MQEKFSFLGVIFSFSGLHMSLSCVLGATSCLPLLLFLLVGMKSLEYALLGGVEHFISQMYGDPKSVTWILLDQQCW